MAEQLLEDTLRNALSDASQRIASGELYRRCVDAPRHAAAEAAAVIAGCLE